MPDDPEETEAAKLESKRWLVKNCTHTLRQLRADGEYCLACGQVSNQQDSDLRLRKLVGRDSKPPKKPKVSE